MMQQVPILHGLLLVIICSLATTAVAASGPEAVPDEPEAAPDEVATENPETSIVPPPLVETVKPFGEDWGWVEFGPKWADRMSDVAVHPGTPTTIVAVALDGEVFKTLDGGQSWQSVLRGLALIGSLTPEGVDQEDVLLRIEARLEEIIGDIDDPNDFEFSESETEVTFDEVESIIREAADEVRVETSSNPWFLEQVSVMSEEASSARPRVWFSENGAVFVGRADGLYRSVDINTWDRVLDVAVTALAYLPKRQLWVAGTQDGVRFSVDALGGRAWIDADDGTEGLMVFDLAASEEGMYAATNRGLWFAADAQYWQRVGHPDTVFLSVLADENWDRGIWLSTDANVFRSDDGGATLRPNFGAPIHGVVSQMLIGPGHVIVAGRDGPWETLDGGTTWTPISRGLSDPMSRSLDWHKGLVIVATNEGVFRLEPILETEKEPGDEPEQIVPDVEGLILDWIPVQVLVEAALHRPGLSSGGGLSRGVSTLLPVLTVEARFEPDTTDLRYDAGLSSSGSMVPGTTLERQGEFTAMARLQWTPMGRKQSSTSSAYPGSDAYTDRVWVMVDGTRIAVADGSNPWLMAQTVSRRIVDYRNRLASDVTDLYFARVELIQARPLMATDSVLEQVELELKLDELEARLDFLSAGAVRRWYTPKTQ
jgi:frataxin-like iron-binding protein CyaY